MFIDPSKAARRSAEVQGLVGNSDWGRSMAGKKGGNPRIETANQARRLNAAQRRLEKQVMQRDGGWADATPEELEEYARLARVKAAANDPPGAVEAEMPIDYDEQIEQLKRRGRMNAR